ncbi:MAG TPA: HAD family hydrolase [Gaiellaceae bacterium]|jgi:putative hydrolase of the HAD superfamily|nr:HAD family hydrolase [Gaiellaceae bacterium]
MIEAVLFDWGDTLFHFAYDEALLEAGWEAGLAALGREGLPGHTDTAARFRERYEPLLWVPGSVDEIEYPGMVRELLGGFDVEVSDEELGRFLEAEHAAWEPARRLGDSTHALLDSLRERGLKTGLVSNAFDPGWLLHNDLERMGLGERLDVAVFSSEVGKRKPDETIFLAALEPLAVAPERALFVGDRRYEDVRGAKRVGMKTAQAFWFRADEDERGLDPDYEAFTPMDVLNIVRRLTGEL